jgi:hypothetical protein
MNTRIALKTLCVILFVLTNSLCEDMRLVTAIFVNVGHSRCLKVELGSFTAIGRIQSDECKISAIILHSQRGLKRDVRWLVILMIGHKDIDKRSVDRRSVGLLIRKR